jgi:hypothetical protein
MGMFTTIIDLLGREYQIKTGLDDCETFRVGQVVNWYVDRDTVGCVKLADGIYEGIPVLDTWPKAEVVIRNHVVLGVFVDKSLYDLYQTYPTIPIPKSAYSAKAWHEWHKRRRQQKRETRRTNRWLNSMEPGARLTALIGRYTRSRLKEKSFMRRILPPAKTTLEEVSEPS